MNDEKLLRRLKDSRKDALEQAIKRYGGYVYDIIRNRSAGILPPEDVEELCSDVFVNLWQHAGEIGGDRLRPWLGSVARNRVTDALRRCEPISKTAPVSFWTRRSTSSSAAVAEHGFST